MRKVLFIGYIPYEEKRQIIENKNIFVLFEENIYNTDNPEVVVEIVRFVDEVAFMPNVPQYERTPYEIACVMLGKKIVECKKPDDKDMEKGMEE